MGPNLIATEESKTLGGLWAAMKDGFDQFIVSVMDSGITDALKSIMGSFSGMGETGTLLSNILGVALGGAMQALAAATQIVTVTLEAFSWTVNTILSPIGWAKDGLVALADSMKETEEEAKAAAEAQAELDRQYWESAKGTGTLAADMQSLIDLSGQYVSGILAEAKAHLDAAGAAERRMQIETALWAKLAEAQAKAEEKAIFDQFEKANEMGPSLPPGFKRKSGKKGGKKKKDPAMEKIKKFSFGGDDYTGGDPLAGMWAEDAAESMSAQVAAREANITALERELELLEAMGSVKQAEVDFIFTVLSAEDEAEIRRQELHEEKMQREIDLAEFQMENAANEEDRLKAKADLDEKLHKRSLAMLEKQQKEETKAARHKQTVIERTQAISSKALEASLDAAEAAMNEEKDIGLKMLANLLEAVKAQAKIKVLFHAAQAIGAFASYQYVAGAKHLAAAAAWGLLWGGAAAGQAAIGKELDKREDERDEAEKEKEKAEKEKERAERGSGSSRSGSSGGSGGRADDDGIPTSYFDADKWQSRQAVPMQPRAANTGPTYQIGNLTVLGTTSEEVGIALKRAIQDAERSAGQVY